jgi:hypothetical protein
MIHFLWTIFIGLYDNKQVILISSLVRLLKQFNLLHSSRNQFRRNSLPVFPRWSGALTAWHVALCKSPSQQSTRISKCNFMSNNGWEKLVEFYPDCLRKHSFKNFFRHIRLRSLARMWLMKPKEIHIMVLQHRSSPMYSPARRSGIRDVLSLPADRAPRE